MIPTDLRLLIEAQPEGSPVLLAYVMGDDDGCAKLLRETTAKQSALPPLASAFQLKGLVSAESFGRVFDHPRFTDFKATFDSGSRSGVLQWVAAFTARGLLTADEGSTLTAYLTTPGPQDLPLAPGTTPADVGRARSTTPKDGQ